MDETRMVININFGLYYLYTIPAPCRSLPTLFMAFHYEDMEIFLAA